MRAILRRRLALTLAAVLFLPACDGSGGGGAGSLPPTETAEDTPASLLCAPTGSYDASLGVWVVGSMLVTVAPESTPPQTNDLWTRWDTAQNAYVAKVPITLDLPRGSRVTISARMAGPGNAEGRATHNLLPDDPDFEGGRANLEVTTDGRDGASRSALLGLFFFPEKGCYLIEVQTAGASYGPVALNVRG